MIQQLELLDVTKTAPDSAVPVSTRGIPIRAPFLDPKILQIPIPDVLYALLRLPRRNVKSEIASKYFALSESKRNELGLCWRKFVDRC